MKRHLSIYGDRCGETRNQVFKMTAKESYFAAIKEKQANGLKDVKFFTADTFDVSEECAYEELNRMHAASDLPDRDVLGKYSPVG